MIKKMLMSIIAGAMAFFIVGCSETVPSVERITTISTTIGKTAGYACELSKTKTEVKDTIFTVLDIASKVVPASGSTFTDAWSTIFTDEIAKYISQGKLDDNSATVVKIALAAATEGLDYIFIKYPQAKDVKDLVGAATTGFIAGYKSVVSVSSGIEPVIDKDAYDHIKAKLSAMK